ncbi:MAG: hypothetical protein ACLPXM_20660 [Terriglobales bacterium]
MLKRLRRILVESFVGAIALGYVFAQGILHFAWVFAAPVVAYVTRREYRGIMERTAAPTGFSLQDALPELVRSCALLLVGYVLLRWLYFKPLVEQSPDPAQEQDPTLGKTGQG